MKATPELANRSMFGVRVCGFRPRWPTQWLRSSIAMKSTLGLSAARAEWRLLLRLCGQKEKQNVTVHEDLWQDEGDVTTTNIDAKAILSIVAAYSKKPEPSWTPAIKHLVLFRSLGYERRVTNQPLRELSK